MIRLENVEKRYGSFQALHPLNLHVRKGEVFGFLGPNGAGKTTTIRTLAGVLTPSAGKVLIDGIDIIENPVESKRRVGYIPDRPYLYEKLTALEFLSFVGRLYGLTDDEISTRGAELLAENDLSNRANELIELFTWHEAALGLVSGIVAQPAEIVDEPMVGLIPTVPEE